jgi:hypothetical protein
MARLHAESCAKSDPSPEARAHVDEWLDASPDKWREHGELLREALDLSFRGFWLGYLTKESVRRGAELLKQELGFEDASPVERMMIEHAVVCHVRLGMIEHLYSRHGSSRMDVIEHWEKRLTLAQRRFTRAATALARVRGLLARAESAKEAAARARSGRTLAVLKQMTG